MEFFFSQCLKSIPSFPRTDGVDTLLKSHKFNQAFIQTSNEQTKKNHFCLLASSYAGDVSAITSSFVSLSSFFATYELLTLRSFTSTQYFP